MNEIERRNLYKAFAATEAFQAVLSDLILFACSEVKDPAVRCGRHDVIAYIQDSLIGTPPEEA